MDRSWHLLYAFLIIVALIGIGHLIFSLRSSKRNLETAKINHEMNMALERIKILDNLDWGEFDGPPNRYELMDKTIPIFDEMEKFGKGVADLDFEQQLAVEECFYRVDDFVLLGNIGKAIEEYKKILAITNSNFDALIGLGDLHVKVEELEEAIEAYNSALKIHPKDDAVHVKIGKVYEEMGAREHALTHYNIAYEINKLNTEALAGIERLYYIEQEMLMGGY